MVVLSLLLHTDVGALGLLSIARPINFRYILLHLQTIAAHHSHSVSSPGFCLYEAHYILCLLPDSFCIALENLTFPQMMFLRKMYGFSPGRGVWRLWRKLHSVPTFSATPGREFNWKWSSQSVEMVIMFSSSLQRVSLVPLWHFQSLMRVLKKPTENLQHALNESLSIQSLSFPIDRCQ